MRTPAALLLALAAALAAPSAGAESPPGAAPDAVAPLADLGTYTDPPVTERRSPGMMITGTALWFAGGLASLAGLGVLVNPILNPCQQPFDDISPPAPGERRAPGHFRGSGGGGERIGTAQQAAAFCGQGIGTGLGAVLLGAGVVLGVSGIPFFAIGNQRVPARPRGADAWVPGVRVGAGSVDLGWRF